MILHAISYGHVFLLEIFASYALESLKKIAIIATDFQNVVDYLWDRLPQSELTLFAIMAKFI